MANIYNRRKLIYSELEPLREDIVGCYKNSMSIEQCVQFLKQDKRAYFETENMSDDSEFLEILREIMWETLIRTEPTRDPSYSYTLFDDEKNSDDFKQIYLRMLKKDNPWVLSWFPLSYQRRIKMFE
jgi:hypothetical protein